MSKSNLGEYPKTTRELRDLQPVRSRTHQKTQGTGLHTLSIGIIGGGIGGVAAAVALHRAGIHATVYERAPELREVGAGMMLWPNATRVLKDFGLLEKVAALSGPNRHFLVRSSSGTILMDIALGQFEVPALCTRRSDLLDALLSALPQESVRLGQDFEYFEQQKKESKFTSAELFARNMTS